MFKKTFLISIIIFFCLMIFTSLVKNKTRNLEKDIQKLKKEVVILEKKLRDARIDFVYLSSPEQLKKISGFLDQKSYSSFDTSRIFSSENQFLKHFSKETKNTLKNNSYEKNR